MKLYYKKLGSGHPLIILHGLYGSGTNWLSIANKLSSLCEVYLVDQRNHGQSPHADSHSYPLLMDDLVELVDDLGMKKVMLLGHSMGGKTAMYFATQHPGRVSKLMVADISPLPYMRNDMEAQQIYSHQQIISALLAIELKQQRSLGEIDDDLSHYLPDKRLRQFLLKNLYRQSGRPYRWRLNLEVLLHSLDNMVDGLSFDEFSVQGFSQFPVLFLKGEQSAYIGPEDEVAIRSLFPGAEIAGIPDAGHWLHAEQPEMFVKLVKSFIVKGTV